MKRFVRNISILAIPIIFMIAVNEFTRSIISEKKPHQYERIIAINSASLIPNKCTWNCHDHTDYCKLHHVKYLKPYLAKTDVPYNGIINSLKKTGDYALANLVFLVGLIPCFIWYFIAKALNIQDEIRNLKKMR